MRIERQKGKKTNLEEGDWVFGMLEWSQYMKCDYKIIQKLPLDVTSTLPSLDRTCINTFLSMDPVDSPPSVPSSDRLNPSKSWTQKQANTKKNKTSTSSSVQQPEESDSQLQNIYQKWAISTSTA